MTHDEAESVRLALGILPGVRVWVGGHNLEAKRVVEPFLTDTAHPPTDAIDIALIAPESAEEAAYFLGKIEARLEQDGIAWIILPPNAAANDLSIQTVEAALGRHPEKLARVPGRPVALHDGHLAHRFAR